MQHRPDWCPDLLTGNRHSGLARLTGPGGQLQIKWQSNRREPKLGSVLAGYIRQLERHSRKSGLQFSFETFGSENCPNYSWKAEIYGTGHLMYDPISKRTFLIETSGSRRETATKALEAAMDSFTPYGTGPEEWSINGLKVRLPLPADLKSWKLVTGRTQLNWVGPKAVISASRNAFAGELLSGMELGDWASKLAGRGTVEQSGPGVRIESIRRRWGMHIYSTTLVCMDKVSDELKHLSVMCRDGEWRPDWTWLGL